jgi:hypothetical protein
MPLSDCRVCAWYVWGCVCVCARARARKGACGWKAWRFKRKQPPSWYQVSVSTNELPYGVFPTLDCEVHCGPV